MSVRYRIVQGKKIPLAMELVAHEDSLEAFRSVVLLVNRETKKRYITEATWHRENHTGPNQLGLHYYLQSVQLPESMKPGDPRDDWYIMALAGGGSYDENRQEVNFSPNIILQPVTPGKEVTVSIPFATSWRRLRWVAQDHYFILADKDKPLTFRPVGTLFLLDIENWMTLSVALQRKLLLQGNGYSASGLFDLNKGLTAEAVSALSEGKRNINELWQAQDRQTEYSNISSLPENLKEAGKAFIDNKVHYEIPIYLGEGGETPVSDEELLPKLAPIHLDALKGNAPTSLGKYYLLWMMKRDPYPGQDETTDGRAEVNMLYASAEVDDPSRTRYVPNKTEYTFNYERTDPQTKTWKPRIGSKYIIATIPQGAEEGKLHHLKLRMVRPMIPIECTGVFVDRMYSTSSLNAVWNYPFEGQLMNLIRIPTYYLDDTPQPPFNQDGDRYYDPILGWVLPNFGYREGLKFGEKYERMTKYTMLPGRWQIKGLMGAFSRVRGSNTVYAVMYRSDRRKDGTWTGDTNNIMVAVRITLDYPGIGVANTYTKEYHYAKLEHYYLGPNCYLGTNVRNLISFAMNPLFWKYCVDEEAIVSRVVPFNAENGSQWLREYYYFISPHNTETDPPTNTNRRLTYMNNRATTYRKSNRTINGGLIHWCLPWLVDQQKAW